jgi:hypothetical protein
MAEPAYSYATHLNIKFDPLKLIDVSSLAKHDNDDEFFFVLSGKFIVDLEGRSVELLPIRASLCHGASCTAREPRKRASS